ncbi:hypothetical protein [Ferrimicrobium sp.]|uniref:hypothetical protein n=1 Tax=Ferrimicrobium sp. TaxID=2926050 RepID=UPI00262AB73D|nr:hypothetical protein [Ferrimicrobium sp.]
MLRDQLNLELGSALTFEPIADVAPAILVIGYVVAQLSLGATTPWGLSYRLATLWAWQATLYENRTGKPQSVAER